MSVGARAGSVTLHPGLWGSIHFYDYIAVLVLSDTLIFAVYWNGIQVVMIDFEKENDWRASVLSYRRLFIIRNLDSMFCHWRWFLLDNQIRFDNMALALFLLWNKTDDILLQKKKLKLSSQTRLPTCWFYYFSFLRYNVNVIDSLVWLKLPVESKCPIVNVRKRWYWVFVLFIKSTIWVFVL